MIGKVALRPDTRYLRYVNRVRASFIRRMLAQGDFARAASAARFAWSDAVALEREGAA